MAMTPNQPAVAQEWRRTSITRHRSGLGYWELARARPSPFLQPYVREYVGWHESYGVPLWRRELPTEIAPLIINFGDAFRLCEPGTDRRSSALQSFITGAFDTFQLVESAGSSTGVQVNLTLLGIRLLVGRPIDDMTNRALAPEDVLGQFAHDLTARLHDRSGWDARFDWLDMALSARIADARPLSGAVQHTWRRLVLSGGRIGIRTIVDEVGWSQRHFIRQFRREFGLSPKVLARILRFDRVVRAIDENPRGDLADLALDAGYYDQSHLNRDVRAFAGITPGQLAQRRLPDSGGLLA